MEQNNSSFKEKIKELWKIDFVKALCIGLAVILLFSAGNLLGSIKYAMDINLGNYISVESNNNRQQQENSPAPVNPVPQETTTAQSVVNTPETHPAATTAAPAETTAAPQAQTPSSSAPQSKEEIVALFNTAANKVKTEATVVTRNFKKQQHLSEHTQLPSLMQSIGTPLISELLKDNTEVKTYDTPERIVEKFPVGEQTWSSRATAADLTEATCVDEGSAYKITLKYISGKDPQGSGVANSFSVMKKEYITDIAAVGSMVNDASFEYFDAVIMATVDKASGRLTWANYHLPTIVTVDTKVGSATVGMMIEEDFTIAY